LLLCPPLFLFRVPLGSTRWSVLEDAFIKCTPFDKMHTLCCWFLYSYIICHSRRNWHNFTDENDD
jgi:hypothetical protein